MTIPVFPTSPVPGDLSREPMWNEFSHTYDSGRYQSSTNWSQPLYHYAFPLKNWPETKTNSLRAFYNARFGKVEPFAFKDPYDKDLVGVTLAATTTMGAGSGFYLYEANSYRVLPDSANFVITCGRSGNLVSGTNYVMSLDNGWIQVVTAPSSIWTGSGEFFRKVHFDMQWTEKSPIWNIFNGTVVLQEILP